MSAIYHHSEAQLPQSNRQFLSVWQIRKPKLLKICFINHIFPLKMIGWCDVHSLADLWTPIISFFNQVIIDSHPSKMANQLIDNFCCKSSLKSVRFCSNGFGWNHILGMRCIVYLVHVPASWCTRVLGWYKSVSLNTSKWVDIEFHGLVDNIWLYYFTLVQLDHNKQENNKQIVCSLEENIL